MFTSPSRTPRSVALVATVALALGAVLAPGVAFAATTPEPSPTSSAETTPGGAVTTPAPTPEPTESAVTIDPAPSVPVPSESSAPDVVTPGQAAAPQTPGTRFHGVGGGDPVGHDTVFSGATADALIAHSLAAPMASTAGIPYLGSMSLNPSESTNYDYFAAGVTLTATGLGGNEKAIITDTSPSGEVYTYDPVTTDWMGTVTTQIRRIDRLDPEVGMHRIEITSANGVMAGADLTVTLSERLNATGSASPSTLNADQFHDEPVVAQASGLVPNEWVTVHISTPDGRMGQLSQTEKADADGNVSYLLRASSAAVTPGPWRVTFLGMDSTRAGFADFFVTPSPDNREVGVVTMDKADLSVTDFVEPGVTFTADQLPPFGLYDVELRDPNNRDYSIGRFRANGDGVLKSSIIGSAVRPGSYRIALINVDTADWAQRSFDVRDTDGSLPIAPTLAVAPASIEVRDIMSDGLRVDATGYQPGEIVQLEVRDQWRQKMDLTSASIVAKQADADGIVSFHVNARKSPAVGTWEVAVGNPWSAGLIQRTTLQVTDASAPASPSPAPSSSAAPAASTPDSTPVGLSLSALTGVGETHSWFVRTKGKGALATDVAEQGADALTEGVAPEAAARAEKIEGKIDDLVDAATDVDDAANVLYKAVWTVPGVAMTMDAAAAAELRSRSDVVSVTPIVTKTLVQPVDAGADAPAGTVEPQNAASDALTDALKTWTTGGKFTGEGTTIAVIDTGVDYTHTDFGGPGEGGRYWAMSGRFSPEAMPAVEEGYYDPNVILQGRDFAGARYSAGGGEGFFPIAIPDDNPIDGPGGGHGTHVAGTAAGRGVNADGTTFTGDYATLTAADLKAMAVAPGSAPQAKIVPLKVFGDYGGSTDLAGAALDWVGGAVAAGMKIDVVNMSLGSAFTAPDDPENALVDALTAQGVVVVIAAGNDGDVTDIGGSPGNSPSALTVGAIASGAALQDAVEVLAPQGLVGTFAAQFSQERDPFTQVDVTAPVTAISPTNSSGCEAFSADDATRVEGKVVWLEWNYPAIEAGQECGSAVRFVHAHDAGAVAVLLTSDEDQFDGGIAGDIEIPGAQLTGSSTAALRPALDAGTLVVRVADEYTSVIDAYDPTRADTVASFTSRGVHGSVNGVVKPDMSAPGVNVISAKMGTGTGHTAMSGTSMATPHTAGIAALARQAHPDWSALRIKTVVMNTATHAVHDKFGTIVSPLRVGTGRADALQATQSQVTVASAENGDLVTASFGVVEVAQDGYTAERVLTLTSTDSVDRTFSVGYSARTETPGASFSLGADTVTVPAGGTATVSLTLAVPDREELRRSIDAGTAQSTQTHVADISGEVTFTPVDGGVPLWITAFAAPKPVSSLAGSAVVFDSLDDTESPLVVTGQGLDQGEADAAYDSRVTPLVAGTTSPAIDFSGNPAKMSMEGNDVLRAGAASTSPAFASPSEGLLTVGVQLAGPVIGLGVTAYPLVMIDANRDGRDDFVMMSSMGRNGAVAVVTYDAGTQQALDVRPLNGLSQFVGQYDNDTFVASAKLSSLGYTDTTQASTMAYRVTTISRYAPAAADGSKIVDRTDRVLFDVFHPPVWFGTTSDGDDDPTAALNPSEIVVHAGAVGAGELMMVAHDNGTGNRVSMTTWSTSAPVVTTGIEVTQMPTKTQYAIGSAFDPAGLVVSAVQSDGSRRALSSSEYSISGFDSAQAGSRELTVAAMLGGTERRTAFSVTIGADSGSGDGSGAGGGSGSQPDPNAGTGNSGAGGWTPRGTGASARQDLATTGIEAGYLGMAAAIALLATGLGAVVVIRDRRRRPGSSVS